MSQALQQVLAVRLKERGCELPELTAEHRFARKALAIDPPFTAVPEPPPTFDGWAVHPVQFAVLVPGAVAEGVFFGWTVGAVPQTVIAGPSSRWSLPCWYHSR
jgi:hypothetical protein